MNKIPSIGERAAIGGYLPQFDEFAWRVYNNLKNNQLEWIKVADPDAGKLDDIQYATATEIHAFQVKWTISGDNISYTDFCKLVPDLAKSWKGLKGITPIGKQVIPHLITNKSLSEHDSISYQGKKIGAFKDFVENVLVNIKTSLPVTQEWCSILDDLNNTTSLDKAEFKEFLKIFDFQFNYRQEEIRVRLSVTSKQQEDVQRISRLITEKVADPKKIIEISANDIIQELNWVDRFKTTFNHDLMIDKKTYQPIETTIQKLNSKVAEHNGGYLFLLGGPGSGKSTLLTQWSKESKERVIRYYAFDFTNPSSQYNYFERGETVNLYFDLVFQLKAAGFYKANIIPHLDISYLRNRLFEQLELLAEDFKKNQRKTFIIIDGLDHIPREYKSVSKSFLTDLLLPSQIPDGIYIILGSQSYDLEDIAYDIKREFQSGNRSITMDGLLKKDVLQYLESIGLKKRLTDKQINIIYEKSQGHPLYLSYLVEQITYSENVDTTIEAFEEINGDIDSYYNKIWQPISKDFKLVQFFGLFSRIRDAININFIKEWVYDQEVLANFNVKAKFLLNQSDEEYTFFHNSFLQFLLEKTAIDNLTNTYDSAINKKYHISLGDYYKGSEVEPIWRMNYHLFQANLFDEFIEATSSDILLSQIQVYRPVDEIWQDAKLGVEIAKIRHDLVFLVRYMFILAELDQRSRYIEPAAFTKELLQLGKHKQAKAYLRSVNQLKCSTKYALKAARLFAEFGDKNESLILFNLAYPEEIVSNSISIEKGHKFSETVDEIEEWVMTASYFIDIGVLIGLINNIVYSEASEGFNHNIHESDVDVRLGLLYSLGESIVEQKKWDVLPQILSEVGHVGENARIRFFNLLSSAIEVCLEENDSNRAGSYLSKLLEDFTTTNSNNFLKISLANLIFKVTGDAEQAFQWIKDVQIKFEFDPYGMGYDGLLDIFHPFIIYNKILNLSGNALSITKAIPAAPAETDEELLVDYGRMLCLITQILTDGLNGNTVQSFHLRVQPILKFFYRTIPQRNSYKNKILATKEEYFDFLIQATGTLGQSYVLQLAEMLINEFSNAPQYWSVSLKRKILGVLFQNGFSKKEIVNNLIELEGSILEDSDIDGRITQCIEHAKIYISLGEPELGEQWLKRAFEESIGVGYRKDYQFSTWIGWFKRDIERNPSNFHSHFSLLYSHLQHLKESTEGRAFWDASEMLLSTTFQFDFSDGFAALQWQLENGLIDFEESFAIILERYIERCSNKQEYNLALLSYCLLFLFLAENPRVSILKKLLSKGHDLHESLFFINLFPFVLNSINTKVIEKNRQYLLRELDEFCNRVKINFLDYYPSWENKDSKEKRESSNTLALKNSDTWLTEEEVNERVSNYISFKSLVDNEDIINSYFDWSNIINKISSQLTLSNLEELSLINQKSDKRGANFFATLSNVALRLGDKKLALNFGLRSLECSSESGWVPFYDGGTRLIAFGALRSLESEVYSKKAFEMFCNDVLSRDYPSTVIQSFDEILPLLADNYDESKIWPEVHHYFKRLMGNSIIPQSLPEFKFSNRTHSQVFIDYLIYLTKNSVNFIKEGSFLLLCHAIEEPEDYLCNLINDETHFDEDFLCELISFLSEIKPSIVQYFIPVVKRLSISLDFSIRLRMQNILVDLSEDVPAPKKIELPAIYSIQLIDNQVINDEKNTINDQNGPQKLFSTFKNQIDKLSDATGLDRNTLIYRAYSIMKRIGNPDEWTEVHEAYLRSKLEAMRLKFSYLKPRITAAKKAIMIMASELVDADVADAGDIEDIATFYDYQIALINEVHKPRFVHNIKSKEEGYLKSDWIENANEHSRITETLVELPDGSIIIGEYSKFRSFEWGIPAEDYKLQLAINDNINSSYNYFFGFFFNEKESEYHLLEGGGPFVIVLHSHSFFQFDFKANWLAINPALARHLGWLAYPEKLFAWCNENGEVMAESVFWRSGNLGFHAPKDGEASEGWLVKVSPKAFRQIKEFQHSLFIQKSVIRSKWNDSELEERRFNQIAPFS